MSTKEKTLIDKGVAIKKYGLRFALLTLFLSFGISCSKKEKNTYRSENNDKKSLYEIDLSQNYPKKTICWQDIANIEYVALQTNENTLIDNNYQVFITDSIIIIFNRGKGDIMRFDRNGKILSQFNNTGGSSKEYFSSHLFTYDKVKHEIYVYDILRRTIVIYSENGSFIRNIKVPTGYTIDAFCSFNDSLLIVNDKPDNDYRLKDHANILYILKKNGTIIDSLSISRSGIIQTSYKSNNKQGSDFLIWTADDLIFDGEKYFFTDISTDTIYEITKSRELKPFLIRKPAVFESKIAFLLDPVFKTKKYFFLNVYEYDSGTEKLEKPGEKMSIRDAKRLLYDLENNTIIEPLFFNNDFKESEISNEVTKLNFHESDNNCGIIGIPADKLVEGLEKGELSGKLKEIASTLKEDDNPVLMIIKFKN